MATKSKSTAIIKRRTKADKQLSEDEYKFCESYLKDGNAARSASLAFDSPGYESRFLGRDKLTLSHIKKYLASRRKEIAKKYDINKPTILHMLIEIAQANMLDFYDPVSMEMVDIRDVPNAGAIKKLKLVNDGDRQYTEIELNDRLKAIDMICKLLGLYEQDELDDKTFKVTVEIVKSKEKS